MMKKSILIVWLICSALLSFSACSVPADEPGSDSSVHEEEIRANGEYRPVELVFVQGALYYCTGRESDIPARCGVMDGMIDKTVDWYDVPDEEGESNFGTGYGYQFVSGTELDVWMQERNQWVRFVCSDTASLRKSEDGLLCGGAELLYGQENLCCSPVSLYYALALAGSGAAGETQQEIYDVLGVRDTQTLSEKADALYNTLYRDEKHCKVYLANSLWMHKDVNFYKSYTDNAKDRLHAECFAVDFNGPKTDKTISNWVHEHTKGLLKPSIRTDADTVAVLLNTVYFKANWVDEFSKKRTAQDAFYRADGTAVQCDFMHADRAGNAVAVEGYTMASIPFEGNVRMFFLLPDEGETLDGLLESRGLAELLNETAAEYREVQWSVPKFSVKSKLNVIPALKRMGVQRAFSDTQADFSAMCDVSKLPGGIAYISQVEQEVAFSLDEEGVEAAAYTEINMNCGSAAPPEETIVMNLNRPFLYGVRDGEGTVLFLGRCDDPTVK